MKATSLVHGLSTMSLALCLAVSATAQDPEGFNDTPNSLLLKYASFDPAKATPTIPSVLRASANSQLWIVQFDGNPTEQGRKAIEDSGAEIHSYLPHNAYVVRMPAKSADLVGQLEGIRYVGQYHAAYRLESVLRDAILDGSELPTLRYNIVVVDKSSDKESLERRIEAIGGRVSNRHPGSILFEVDLNGDQLLQAASFDEVLWIDRWSAPEEDMDNARIQGGANYVEAQGSWTGTGVNGHIYEGVEANHPDFIGGVTPVRSSNTAASHGHATAGIVFGNGTIDPTARGMAPDVGKFFTNYNSVSGSRYQVVSDLVNIHDVSFTTASWGDARTRDYTSVSADADDIIFDHNIVWTQSQSNAGNPDSRPQAWAKNIMSIGGVRHGDNADRNDDRWGGGGSTGPSADGRIKPDLSAYYDSIKTSDRTGSLGYSNGSVTLSFGGTSGATPIVAGHNALAIEMFTDNIFGNTPKVPGGSRHDNRANFTTHKALMIANARQYAFNASSTDNRREQVGWGFPDLRQIYDNRANMVIVDEEVALTQGQSWSQTLTLTGNEPELKVAMTYADPAGNPAVLITRNNDLNLKVTAPDGTIYWGNAGLRQGNYSTAGGNPDGRDTVECVFINSPQAGDWTIEVEAPLVVVDGRVETPAVDADFGLVVSNGTVEGSISDFGQGCVGTATLPPVCAGVNQNGGSLTNQFRDNEYAYRFTLSSATTINGFEIFSASSGGNQVVTARLYAASGNAPGTALAQGTCTIGPAQAFYSATLPATTVQAGTYFVAIDHSANNTMISTLSGGQSGVAFWRDPAFTGSWSQSSLVQRPGFRVNCAGTGTGPGIVPDLTISGVPAVGNFLDRRIDGGLANAPALILTGASDTTSNYGPLPASLGAFGAPGCQLFVSDDLVEGVVLDANGALSLQAEIPALPNILGAKFYQQAALLDAPANVLGIVTTDAVRIVVGS